MKKCWKKEKSFQTNVEHLWKNSKSGQWVKVERDVLPTYAEKGHEKGKAYNFVVGTKAKAIGGGHEYVLSRNKTNRFFISKKDAMKSASKYMGKC